MPTYLLNPFRCQPRTSCLQIIYFLWLLGIASYDINTDRARGVSIDSNTIPIGDFCLQFSLRDLLHLFCELRMNTSPMRSTTTRTYDALRIIRRLLNLPCSARRKYELSHAQRSRCNQTLTTHSSEEVAGIKTNLIFVSASIPQAKSEDTANRRQSRLETF